MESNQRPPAYGAGALPLRHATVLTHVDIVITLPPVLIDIILKNL